MRRNAAKPYALILHRRFESALQGLAARGALRGWAATPWRDRVALLRRTAALIEERVYVERAVAGALRARLIELTRAIKVGDPTERDTWMGRGSTGKAIGSFWYLPLYMREQSQTVVEL